MNEGYSFNQRIQQAPIEGSQRPPLGLKPRSIHEDQRREEIRRAIERYVSAKKDIPYQWLEELNELERRAKKGGGE